jgi:hypothetical protein
MIFDVSIFIILILAGVDAANEIINSQIERAIELEAELNGENSRSSNSGNNNNNNEQQPEPPSIEQTIIRAKFQEELFNLQYSKENNNNESSSSGNGQQTKKSKKIRLFTKQSIAEITNSLENPSTDPKYYHRKKQFRLTETVPPCLVKIDPPGKYDVQRLVIAAEDMFDICLKIHKNVGYQGRQGMEKEAKKFYYNVTRPIIELFLQYSSEYQTKRKKTVNHGLVVKPIISENFNSRGQNDLVDMHSLPDGEYHYILNY